MIRIAKKIKGMISFDILPWIWMVAGFLYDIWYQIFPGKYIVDSDLASEMVLADLLNSTGEILSKDWFYSSELRVFQSQWFYRIGLLIFPDNWHCARIVAAALLLIVFAATLLLAGKLAGLGKYSVWCAAIMMWPFGRWYLVYGLYGTYYIIYMLFSLLTVSLLIAANRNKGLKAIFLCIAGGLVAFAAGLNGIKQTLVFFAPLFVAVFLLLLWAIRERKTATFGEMLQSCRSEARLALQATLFVGCNGAGYLVNSQILSKIYTFEGFNTSMWVWEPDNKLYDIWLDFVLLFGHQREVPVVSFRGIAAVLGIAVGFAVAFSIIRLRKHYDKMSVEQRLIWLLTVSILVVDAVIFCLIGYYKQYYWLPCLPFAISVLLLEIKLEDFSLKKAREMLLIGLAACITLCSFATVKKEMETPLFTQIGFNEVADWLVENGYTEGYALFWSSNVLREMSDGKIETWTIYSGEHDVIYEWLQEKDHLTRKPEEPYFLLVNKWSGGGPEAYNMLVDGKGKLVYEKDPFYIYVFDSSEEAQ